MDNPAPLCAHWKKSHCLPFWKLQVKKFRPLLGPSFRTVLIKQRFPWWQTGKCKSAHCDREKIAANNSKLLFQTRRFGANRVMKLFNMLQRILGYEGCIHLKEVAFVLSGKRTGIELPSFILALLVNHSEGCWTIMGCTTRHAGAAALRLLWPDKVKEDAYTQVPHQLLLVSKQPLLNGAVTCW